MATPLTSDLLAAAFAQAGMNGDNAPDLVGGMVGLVMGLAGLNITTPAAMTDFITTAGKLVQRESLNGQILAAQRAVAAQQAASQAAQQALQAQIATLESQIGQ